MGNVLGATAVTATVAPVVAEASKLLALKFSNVKVNKVEVKKAEDALARVAVTDYQESLIHDITCGLERNQLEEFAEDVVKLLRL